MGGQLGSAPLSVIRKALNRIFAAGQPGGIASAEESTNKSDEAGPENPSRCNQNRKRREKGEKPCSNKVTQTNPGGNTQKAEQSSFRKQSAEDRQVAGAKGFEDADVAGALKDGGVHRQENHQKADGDGQGDHEIDESLQAGNIGGSHEGHEFLEGTYRIVGQKIFDFPNDVVGVLWARTFDKENRGFLAGAHQVSQRCERHKQSSGFPMLDDANHVPFVIQESVGVANLEFLGLGGPIIDQQIVRFLQIVSFQKHKTI